MLPEKFSRTSWFKKMTKNRGSRKTGASILETVNAHFI
jgi:hypothetical protein